MHYNILDLLKFRVTLLCLELNTLFSVLYGQCYDFRNQSDCRYCCYDNCLQNVLHEVAACINLVGLPNLEGNQIAGQVEQIVNITFIPSLIVRTI